MLSCVQLFATPWTVALQSPPSMEFSRQEYWSGLPFPSPGDLPDPGIKPGSSTLQTDALPSEPPGSPSYIKHVQFSSVQFSGSVMSDSLRPHELQHDRRRQWHPTPVLLPGESHGRRSLVGCSSWGCEESDTTERLSSSSSLSLAGTSGKELACQCRRHKRHGFDPWVREIPWRKTRQPTPVFLPRESSQTGETGGLQFIGSERVGYD